MTKQYIWALAIAGAFVAGTILASTMYDNTAFAIHQPNHNPPGDDDDMGWKEAVADLQMQIDNVSVDDADSDPTNELQTISDDGGVTLSDGGGTVDCEDITGSEDLCDGVDDVGEPELPNFRTYQRFNGEDIPANDFLIVRVFCDEGDVATGHGRIVREGLRLGNVQGINSDGLVVSGPGTPVGMLARYTNPTDEPIAGDITVICANTNP